MINSYVTSSLLWFECLCMLQVIVGVVSNECFFLDLHCHQQCFLFQEVPTLPLNFTSKQLPNLQYKYKYSQAHVNISFPPQDLTSLSI